MFERLLRLAVRLKACGHAELGKSRRGLTVQTLWACRVSEEQEGADSSDLVGMQS